MGAGATAEGRASASVPTASSVAAARASAGRSRSGLGAGGVRRSAPSDRAGWEPPLIGSRGWGCQVCGLEWSPHVAVDTTAIAPLLSIL